MLHYSNYWVLDHGNFGDDLNPWLWSRLAPEVCDQSDPTVFFGIGTILSRSARPETIKVVFGSGCGVGLPPKLDSKWFFYAVRGPLTAAKLGIDPAFALGDPAILVRRTGLSELPKTYPVSFMPHHQSMFLADWKTLCAGTGIHCIDSQGKVEEVIREIQQSEVLIAEAMHGAIVADALRVPWIPARVYGNFMEFKWRDWTQSIKTPLEVAEVPPLFGGKPMSGKGTVHALKKVLALSGLGKEKWKRLPARPSTEREINRSLRALEDLARTQTRWLSKESVMLQSDARLFEKLSELRSDWRSGKFKPSQATRV
ncbi:MAG: hypothetical protein QOJ40_2594 [Verrucomicrobiota bacterium]